MGMDFLKLIPLVYINPSIYLILNFRIFKISENEVRLMGDSDKNYNANIYDFSGRLIKTLNFDHKVDVSNLKKGIHVLKLSSEGVITTKKFVVE